MVVVVLFRKYYTLGVIRLLKDAGFLVSIGLIVLSSILVLTGLIEGIVHLILVIFALIAQQVIYKFK